ncbi:unnamed protein product [Effrenium voratum]|uniref:Coronin n=1 Tax=Effrenium voratum TaxID=2562239 RepID=A0AA36N6Z3_9DINO|nr:unnamed protein product [Effrenium voratum]CAJ1412730.1 unnamed protein product [Effrenium voratum]
MKVVRESKFRHVFGEASKENFQDLRLSSKPLESTGIRGNAKFVAFPWESGGGGTLAVLPSTKYGRLPRDLPLVTGHTGGIMDFEFNPFDDNLLVSASEDMTIKMWQIPEGGLTAHLKDPLLTLEGHGKKVSFCTFNPSAANILATTSFDMTCKVWNLAEQEAAFSIPLPEQVMHVKWNYVGSLLAITCKDKKVHIVDPRQNKVAGTAKVCDGPKPSKVEWISSPGSAEDCHCLITTGFTSQAERQISMWDTRMFPVDGDKTQGSLQVLNVDQGTGALYPFFDPGTQMLYVAGKGDSNVRYFEVVNHEPYLHYLETFKTNVPQKGFDFLPKRCVNVGCHEIMKGLKLETSAIQPVSFRVPRKSEAFQEDLFPDCLAGVPTMGPDEWLSNSRQALPILTSMKPGAQKAAGGAGLGAPAVVSVKDLKKQLAEAQERIKTLETENEMLKQEMAKAKA